MNIMKMKERGRDMKRVVDYITEKDVKDFCGNCNELCSRHCVIWRKAENEYNEDERKSRK